MSASRKLQLFESDMVSFYNQVNWTEEYKYDKGLYYNNHGDEFDEDSGKSDSDFDSKSDSDSHCESERNSKNNVKSEGNVIVSINALQSLITSATSISYCYWTSFTHFAIERGFY